MDSIDKLIENNNLTTFGLACFTAGSEYTYEQLKDFNFMQQKLNVALDCLSAFNLMCTEQHVNSITEIYSDFLNIKNGYGWISVQNLITQFANTCTFLEFKAFVILLLNNNMLVNEQHLNGSEEEISEVQKALLTSYAQVQNFL